jgi:hypothetical protein
MKETELKIELAKRRDLSEPKWEYLRDLGYVLEAVEEFGQAETDPVGYLVRKFDAAANAFASTAPASTERTEPSDVDRRTPEHSQQVTPEIGGYEGLRATVLSEYLAKVAAIDAGVVQFRNDVLGGSLLTPEEVRAFLSSPATRYLSGDVWRAYGIPAKHTATLLDESYGRTEDGPFHWVQVRTDPPGETHAVFIPNPQSYDYLPYFAEDGRPKRVGYWQGSVLGDLRKLCKELTKGHPWGIDEATWFVLTGETPPVQPIRAKIHSTWVPFSRALTTISVTAQPWVRAETVEGAYRQAQRQALGGDNKRIGDKSLRILEFVIRRADADGNLPSGRTLVEEWDEKWVHQEPKWCYGGDTRTFWRDFGNAKKSVTNSKRAGLFLEAGVYGPEEYIPDTIG